MALDDLQRWGYIFLVTDTSLTLDTRVDIIGEAVEMYFNAETERDLCTDTYEGRLTTNKKYEQLGQFGGQRFDAIIETDDGKAKLRFLLTEETGAGMGTYSYSRN